MYALQIWKRARKGFKKRYSHFLGHYCVTNGDKSHHKSNSEQNKEQQIHSGGSEGTHWGAAVLHDADLGNPIEGKVDSVGPAEETKAIHLSEVTLHLSSLAGPTSQFINGKHEFSELVMARMALLINKSRSVLPLRS